MMAGRPHEETTQFLAPGTVFRQRRVAEAADGSRYVVVPADLPDGCALELWIAPELVPLLAAALAGRPVPPSELGASQPQPRRIAGARAAWVAVDEAPALRDPCDPAGGVR